jgi:DNA primase large subunit
VEFRENDNISHFICRLAYSRNEELRKWFLAQETRLFSVRINEADPKTVKQLLEAKCGLGYEIVRKEDEDWIKFQVNITFKAKDAVEK